MAALDFHNKNVLITGASSGIGAALAREFFAKGANLVLLARRVERLGQLATELTKTNPAQRVLFYPCDVSRDGDLPEVVVLAKKELGPMHVVVANAGFGVSGNFQDLSLGDYRRQFETNVFGVLRTVYATLADLRHTKGSLAVLGSVMGYITLPGASPYGMSKYAIRAFCESLAEELRPQGISVTHIAPGFVNSEIHQVDNQGVHHPNIEDRVTGPLRVPADIAARTIVRAVLKRKPEQVITAHGRVIVWLKRHFPGFVRFSIRLMKFQGRPEPS